MYQHVLISLMLAAAPMASPQAPAGEKPAASTTKKPASPTQKPAAGATQKPATEKPGAAAAAKSVRTIEIIGTEDMKFSLANIAAKRGEQLRVRLVSKGAMPKIAMAHNFVLLNKGVSQVDFVQAAMNARATDFIPADKKGDVLAHTALAGAGETVEVTFKVPAAAGDYPYICSFPGHFQAGMRGMLNVK
jgi:azurin